MCLRRAQVIAIKRVKHALYSFSYWFDEISLNDQFEIREKSVALCIVYDFTIDVLFEVEKKT